MTFTNTDCVQEKVEINQLLGYWKVYGQVHWKVYEQVYEQVYLQVLRSFDYPIKIKIYKETRK